MPGDRRSTAHAAGTADTTGGVRLFLCGDVMTGRGIDQILPHPGKPGLYERWVTSAVDYVSLAERANGPLPRPVDPAYPWGDALALLAHFRPQARIVNLETAVTASDDAEAGKGIHYRMHPANLPCLTAAGIDCCVLANNHVMDWGLAGLHETVATLHAAHIRTAGAGRNAVRAAAPAVVVLAPGRRILVFAYGEPGSGVAPEWAARGTRAGVNFLPELSMSAADAIARHAKAIRRSGDIVAVSLHWGGNWGFGIPRAQRDFARRLVDAGGADIVYGHSSHHVKGIEVYRGRLVLYGCGDFLNDYEGIGGYEKYRPDLCLMYLPVLDSADGSLRQLRLVPLQIRRMRLQRASREDAEWLRATLEREGEALGTQVDEAQDDTLALRWHG
jgi:poly-gamma-glutamate synthesis protein (capsule biosynthesis protein)